MSAPLDSIADYSNFVYALAQRHPFVIHSPLTLAPIGATLGKLEGRVECQDGIHLEVCGDHTGLHLARAVARLPRHHHHSKRVNSSTVMPAARIKLRSVPLATS